MSSTLSLKQLNNELEILETAAAKEIAAAEDSESMEKLRLSFLGKKGKLSLLLGEMKNLSSEERPVIGQRANVLKNQLQELIKERLEILKAQNLNQILIKETIDVTAPPIGISQGHRHPLITTTEQIIDLFLGLGYQVSEGPEIENDYYNFEALNIPSEHPARDMQDTFFIQTNPDVLLRTHTSSVQVRYMQKNKPPIRILSPGRVYRNEAVSARSHCIFHQVEGLYINTTVSFSDLKQVLLYFAKEMFGEKTKIRLRPSYFPFTEPSAEVDVSCNICSGSGCNVCKHTGYLEILGCGMIDPNVLENCGIDSKKYSGYAFGMGIERIAMLKYGIKDLRLFYENDIRFLSQFANA